MSNKRIINKRVNFTVGDLKEFLKLKSNEKLSIDHMRGEAYEDDNVVLASYYIDETIEEQ